MLHVRSLSGERVAELHEEELKARLQESEESLVVVLKRLLGDQLGCSRFRLKLVENSKEIDDDAPLTGPAEIQLVRMDFQSDLATNAAFMSACKEGRVTEVEHLLHAPQNPDARDAQNKWMGIHLAAGNGHLDVVRLLLEAGVDKDAAMQGGARALHLAALRGQLDIVRFLLEAGADKDAVEQRGARALHFAADQGHLDVVRFLLEAGADKDAVEQRGARALHLAANHGHLDVVRLLLKAGADKDAVMQSGATALHLAAEHGYLDVVQLLLEGGAVKDAVKQVVATDSDLKVPGATALHLALEKGHRDVVRLLLEAGWRWQRGSDARFCYSFALSFSKKPFGCSSIAAAGRCCSYWPRRARSRNWEGFGFFPFYLYCLKIMLLSKNQSYGSKLSGRLMSYFREQLVEGGSITWVAALGRGMCDTLLLWICSEGRRLRAKVLPRLR